MTTACAAFLRAPMRTSPRADRDPVDVRSITSRTARRDAVLALAAQRTARAEQALLGVLRDDSEEPVRVAAARGLASCGGPAAVAALRPLARVGSSPLREAAVSSLGILDDTGSDLLLEGRLVDPTWQVRAAAARALGRLEGAAGVDGLAGALADEQWPVRMRAREALVAMGTCSAIMALRDNRMRVAGLRSLDARRARNAMRRRLRCSARGRPRMDRLWAVPLSAAITLTILTVLLTAASFGWLGAEPVSFFGIAGLSAVFLALLDTWAADKDNGPRVLLDLARARAERTRTAAVTPLATTLLRLSRPLRVVSIFTVPVVLDSAFMSHGIVAGLATGYVMSGLPDRFRQIQDIRRFERTTQAALLTESASSPLPGRQYYLADPRNVE
jgi:hypothetical protein